jgi:hypothetical protein
MLVTQFVSASRSFFVLELSTWMAMSPLFSQRCQLLNH